MSGQFQPRMRPPARVNLGTASEPRWVAWSELSPAAQRQAVAMWRKGKQTPVTDFSRVRK